GRGPLWTTFLWTGRGMVRCRVWWSDARVDRCVSGPLRALWGGRPGGTRRPGIPPMHRARTVSPSACGVLTSPRSVEQGGGPVRAAGRISSWRRFPRPTVVDGRSGRPAVRPPTAGATPAARRAVRRRAHRHTRGRAGPAAGAAGSRHPRRTSPAHQRLQRHAAGVRHPVPHRGPESGLRLRLERGPRPRPTVVCASGRVLSCRRTGLRRRGCRPLRRDRPRSRRAIPALPSSVSWLPARPRSVS
ncbi:MAG: hypothetical protein QOF96_706, partial [Actinomycetota bacterium]|nr:hypothetical protein [Actinomycetota bacterium]